MSVPKSRRGESPAEYINLAREIYVFTYNRVRILPKSYTFYFSLPLYNAAREAYRMIKTANLIYVDEKSPEEIRRRNIQRRKEYYETAQGYIKGGIDRIERKQDAQDARYIGMAERMSAVESSAKSAHHRIDRLEGREVREDG